MIKDFWQSKKIFFLATIIAGVLVLHHFWDFQPHVTAGDVGRDLYAFQATMQGATPYQDYGWCYGPTMPYVYASAFKVFGAKIEVAWRTLLFIRLGSMILFYVALSCFATPAFSFLGSLCFHFAIDFFMHTYNHEGGIFFQILLVLFVFLYIKSYRKIFVYLGFLTLSILTLIKINLFFLAPAFFLSLILIDRLYQQKRMRLYCGCFLASVAVLFLIYSFFLCNLSQEALLQTIPILSQYRDKASFYGSLGGTASFFFKDMILPLFFSWKIFLAAVIVVLCFFRFSFLRPSLQKNKIIIILLALIVLWFFSFNEYFGGSPLYGRKWGVAFLTLWTFIVLSQGTQGMGKPWRWIIYFLLCFSLAAAFTNQNKKIKTIKSSDLPFRLHLAKGEIYTANPPNLNEVFRQATMFFELNVDRGELFFAFPYDPLYYFLLNRKTPTRLLCFQKNVMNISLRQEMETVKDLERSHVKWIIFSDTRFKDFIDGYCPYLTSYIFNHFELVAGYGEWTNDLPEWINAQAVMILKRKSLFVPASLAF
ncbi:MAG: hypothetical protein WCX16_01675 [Candidatus Omnitrophota bacterium]